MNAKMLAVGLGVILLLCAVVLAFEVQPPSDAPAGRSAGSRATNPRSARSVAPNLSRRADPDPAGPVTGPPDQAPPGPPPAPAPPLPPDQENARLRKIFDDSGGAAGDALDRTSHDLANDLVTQVRARNAQVDLQAVECRAAGCTATLEVAAEADFFRLRDLLQGMDPRSPIARWPGSRIMPPAMHRDGKVVVTIMMIRPDSRAPFQ